MRVLRFLSDRNSLGYLRYLCLAPWIPSLLAPSFPGCLAPSFPGSLALWLPSSLAPRRPGPTEARNSPEGPSGFQGVAPAESGLREAGKGPAGGSSASRLRGQKRTGLEPQSFSGGGGGMRGVFPDPPHCYNSFGFRT